MLTTAMKSRIIFALAITLAIASGTARAAAECPPMAAGQEGVCALGPAGNFSARVGTDDAPTEIAQRFTTGAESYRLRTISILAWGVHGAPGAMVVELRSADGARVLAASESTPPRLGKRWDFAFHDSVALAPNTAYFIVMRAPNVPGDGNYYPVATLDADAKIASAGWSADSNALQNRGGAWDFDSASRISHLQIAVVADTIP